MAKKPKSVLNHPKPVTKRDRDAMRGRMRSAIRETFGTPSAMRNAWESGTRGRQVAEVVYQFIQDEKRSKADEKSFDIRVETALAFAAMTGRRVGWVLTGEEPEFVSEPWPRGDLAHALHDRIMAELQARGEVHASTLRIAHPAPNAIIAHLTTVITEDYRAIETVLKCAEALAGADMPDSVTLHRMAETLTPAMAKSAAGEEFRRYAAMATSQAEARSFYLDRAAEELARLISRTLGARGGLLQLSGEFFPDRDTNTGTDVARAADVLVRQVARVRPTPRDGDPVHPSTPIPSREPTRTRRKPGP